MKKALLILLALLTQCTLQEKFLTTNELIEWSVSKDTVYYLHEPVAKIVVWVKATGIPINSTCVRSQDYRSREHYEVIHGINTLETLMVQLKKNPELHSRLIKFVNTNYTGMQIIK